MVQVMERRPFSTIPVETNVPDAVVGRRTGIAVERDVKKDSFGFEDIDEFWKSMNLSTPEKMTTTTSCPTTGKRTGVLVQPDRPRDATGFEKLDEYWKRQRSIELDREPLISSRRTGRNRKTVIKALQETSYCKDVRKDSLGFDDLDEFWEHEPSHQRQQAPHLRKIPKDSLGFEDVQNFWSDPGLPTQTKKQDQQHKRYSEVRELSYLKDVRKDSLGFDHVDDFWIADESTQSLPPVSSTTDEELLEPEDPVSTPLNPQSKTPEFKFQVIENAAKRNEARNKKILEALDKSSPRATVYKEQAAIKTSTPVASPEQVSPATELPRSDTPGSVDHIEELPDTMVNSPSVNSPTTPEMDSPTDNSQENESGMDTMPTPATSPEQDSQIQGPSPLSSIADSPAQSLISAKTPMSSSSSLNFGVDASPISAAGDIDDEEEEDANPLSTPILNRSLKFTSSSSKKRRLSQQLGERKASPLSSPPVTPKRRVRKYIYKDTPEEPDVKYYGNADTEDETYLVDDSASDGGETECSTFMEDEESALNETSHESLMDLSTASVVMASVEEDPVSEEAGGLRRSKRRRFKPLKWYKGEHLVYERQTLGIGVAVPTVKGIERAGTKTPVAKPRRARKTKRANVTKVPNTPSFDKKKLPQEFMYNTSGYKAEVWDPETQSTKRISFLSRKSNLQLLEVPRTQEDEDPITYAGQSFNVPGYSNRPSWISGILEIPPKSYKQPETVGECTQIFHVMHGQPNALEVALGSPQETEFNENTAQRFTLSLDDEFYVPPDNAYMLYNHSETVTAQLRFFILKKVENSSISRMNQSFVSTTMQA